MLNKTIRVPNLIYPPGVTPKPLGSKWVKPIISARAPNAKSTATHNTISAIFFIFPPPCSIILAENNVLSTCFCTIFEKIFYIPRTIKFKKERAYFSRENIDKFIAFTPSQYQN